ncbi:MAG: alpha/beta hydrolase family protein [Pseudomonadales bacterium]
MNKELGNEMLGERKRGFKAQCLPLGCFCALVFSQMLSAAEELYTDQSTVTPELAVSGKYKVGVKTLVVSNPNQANLAKLGSVHDRSLTLEVWYPADVKLKMTKASYKNVTRSHKAFELAGDAYRDAAPIETTGSFPLIVVSHGYTGYRTIMFYLAEHLASHGYVVAAIDHTDSTNAEVDMVASPGSGFASTLVHRSRDQQFVLDYFTADSSPIAKIVNTDAAAVLGYSMGGYGAIGTVGACFDFSAEALQQFGVPAEGVADAQALFNVCNAGRTTVDPRWKALVAFSPWGGEQKVHNAESMRHIKVPTLYAVGSEDDVSGFENGVKHLYQQTGSKDKYLMVYENARHNIAAHPAPKIAYSSDLDIGHHYEPAWNIETLNRINEHMSLAFLDCYVKQVQESCSYLPVRDNITQTRGADGKLTQPWPGFPERWGTGVRFYRGDSVSK